MQTTARIPIRYADTDAQGVVFFANYLTLMDEAATAHLDGIGFAYKALRALGADFVYARAEVDYRSSLRYGDALEVDCVISRVGTTSYSTRCTLRVGERVAAEGTLVHVCIGPESTPIPVPPALRTVLMGGLAG